MKPHRPVNNIRDTRNPLIFVGDEVTRLKHFVSVTAEI